MLCCVKGSNASAIIVIRAPMDAIACTRRESRSFTDPQGPLDAESYRCRSKRVFCRLKYRSHLSWPRPLVIGRSIKAFVAIARVDIIVFKEIPQDHSDKGRPSNLLSTATALMMQPRESRAQRISSSHWSLTKREKLDGWPWRARAGIASVRNVAPAPCRHCTGLIRLTPKTAVILVPPTDWEEQDR